MKITEYLTSHSDNLSGNNFGRYAYDIVRNKYGEGLVSTAMNYSKSAEFVGNRM